MPLSPQTEKKLLQFAVALACCVPILAGASGAAGGIAFLGTGSIGLDSHFRYLSGLLLGIGLLFACSIPRIEAHTAHFRLLTIIVFTGGLARLLGAATDGLPGGTMTFALVMELFVTPLLCAWQHRIARRLR